jgi:signal transduction histidine kinase
LTRVKTANLPAKRKPAGSLIGRLDLNEVPGSGLDAEPGILRRGARGKASPGKANPATIGLTELPATSVHADLDTDSLRILVLTPAGQDGPALAQVLNDLGMRTEVCANLAELTLCLQTDGGAVLMSEEVLFGKSLADLAAHIERQPPWSDLPFIVLASHRQQSPIVAWRQRMVTMLGNVSVLDRPVTAIALASSVQSALKARQRQYEVRMHLAEREQSAQNLEARVATRTSKLAAANVALRSQIAERKVVDASLRQAQNTEAVGQLTSGIAHDFNNMLQAISGSLELIQRRIEQGRTTETGRYLDSARKTVERAAAVTNRLLAFSRRQPLQSRPVDLSRLIAGIEELVRLTVGPEINVNLSMQGGLWPVLCDPNQLETALLNVAINARDAMPQGGKLSISTLEVPLRTLEAAGPNGAEPGDYVEIAIADTGTGMEEAIRVRACEPFFTTKPTDQGAGLGLSQVNGFVRQSGGYVRLESIPGEGTTVRLGLPRHRNAAAQVMRQPLRVRPERATAAPVVLLVEDEAAVRDTSAELLGELGYRVLQAHDGPTALAMLACSDHVDLLVTDVGLPNGLNGRQIADAARQRWLDLPVLFITGYGGSVLGDELAPDTHVIRKPFTLDGLAARIAAMLEPPASMVPSPGSTAGQVAGRQCRD